jgi:hypothetical protein
VEDVKRSGISRPDHREAIARRHGSAAGLKRAKGAMRLLIVLINTIALLAVAYLMLRYGLELWALVAR